MLPGGLSNNILYSCVDAQQRGHEQFVREHSLGYIIAGETYLQTNEGTSIYGPGTLALVKRSQLIKSVKVPPANGSFIAINILLDQDALRRYAVENNLEALAPYTGDSLIHLPDDPFLKGYFESLMPYFDRPAQLTKSLSSLKTTEAIELLLKLAPALKNLLFDFSEPHKIDLEAFMNEHYKYNVPAIQFAKLTGRSLAGFKRDFEKVFKASPGQWLLQKRLKEAYYLIKEKKKKPSDVYLDVGFENLSHFSFAFKKAFGMAPSLV